MWKLLLLLPLVAMYVRFCETAPVVNMDNMAMFEVIPARYAYNYHPNHHQNHRIFWNSVGDWIMGSEWFPIEVNVPDIISNIVSSTSGAIGGTLQRIPVINRITSAVQPRPNGFLLLVPTQQNDLPNQGPFTPFNSFANKFPTYP